MEEEEFGTSAGVEEGDVAVVEAIDCSKIPGIGQHCAPQSFAYPATRPGLTPSDLLTWRLKSIEPPPQCQDCYAQ